MLLSRPGLRTAAAAPTAVTTDRRGFLRVACTQAVPAALPVPKQPFIPGDADGTHLADPKDQKDSYASPVYGNFSKGLPPTLIQGGLKETLLSGFVRLYQALDTAWVPVKPDLNDGMTHNFQDRIPGAPESILARRKMRDFLNRWLGVAT